MLILNPLGVVLDNELKFDDHISAICRKISAQISARSEQVEDHFVPKKRRSLYGAFILPYFNYCSQVWHHCGKRSTTKLKKFNKRALRYIFKDKSASYQDLLELRIRLEETCNSKNPRHSVDNTNSR